MSPADAYAAMQKGGLEGITFPAFASADYKLYEVGKAMTRPLFGLSNVMTLVNVAKLNSLPPDLQKILIEEGRKIEAIGKAALDKVAEDDEAVRHLTRRILEEAGYTVLEAANGLEALQASGAHKAGIHLLLTDLIMPQMGGRELAQRLAPLRADMPVLFMSGYTEDAVVHHGVVDKDVAFLQKPFTPAALTRKVREMLDSAAKNS